MKKSRLQLSKKKNVSDFVQRHSSILVEGSLYRYRTVVTAYRFDYLMRARIRACTVEGIRAGHHSVLKQALCSDRDSVRGWEGRGWTNFSFPITGGRPGGHDCSLPSRLEITSNRLSRSPWLAHQPIVQRSVDHLLYTSLPQSTTYPPVSLCFAIKISESPRHRPPNHWSRYN